MFEIVDFRTLLHRIQPNVVCKAIMSDYYGIMKEIFTQFKILRTDKKVLILSIIVSGYWWLGHCINLYSYAFVGAIFEILWFPFLLILFALPIISMILLIKEKVYFRSLYIYSILIGIITILFFVLGK